MTGHRPAAAGDSFTCPHCGRTSHHPRDREEGYCGACHWWTGVPDLYEPWRAERLPQDLTRK